MRMYEKIIGLVISIGLIIAGLSGQYVLIGTGSSELLVIVGVILLIVDLYYIYIGIKNKE